MLFSRLNFNTGALYIYIYLGGEMVHFNAGVNLPQVAIRGTAALALA